MATDPWEAELRRIGPSPFVPPAEGGGTPPPDGGAVMAAALASPLRPQFDGQNIRPPTDEGKGRGIAELPADADDPGWVERLYSMGRGAQPERNEGGYGETPAAPLLYTQQGEAIISGWPSGPPHVGSPPKRVILSWGRDPDKIVVGIERTSDGEMLLTRSVEIGAWRQLAQIVAELVEPLKVKDLTGGDWEEADARVQPRRKARAARPRAGGPGAAASGEP